MNNFARAHNSYLEPPDDDPACEDCGETLVRNPFSDRWFCENPFCPLKFEGIEKKMAEALVEYKEKANTYKAQYEYQKAEMKDLRLHLSAALENTTIYKCRSCEGYYNQGMVCSCGRDNSYSDNEWEELQKGE